VTRTVAAAAADLEVAVGRTNDRYSVPAAAMLLGPGWLGTAAVPHDHVDLLGRGAALRVRLGLGRRLGKRLAGSLIHRPQPAGSCRDAKVQGSRSDERDLESNNGRKPH
jgi:hypothetical protein